MVIEVIPLIFKIKYSFNQVIASFQILCLVADFRPVDITCPADGMGNIELTPGVFLLLYSNPVCTGGAGMVAVSCNPPSGSTVGLGTSVVTCSCTDERNQEDECAFTITTGKVFFRFISKVIRWCT